MIVGNSFIAASTMHALAHGSHRWLPRQSLFKSLGCKHGVQHARGSSLTVFPVGVRGFSYGPLGQRAFDIRPSTHILYK